RSLRHVRKPPARRAGTPPPPGRAFVFWGPPETDRATGTGSRSAVGSTRNVDQCRCVLTLSTDRVVHARTFIPTIRYRPRHPIPIVGNMDMFGVDRMTKRKTVSKHDDGGHITITAKGAAQILNLSDRTITALARRGRLAHTFDTSGRRIYDRAELERYDRERK